MLCVIIAIVFFGLSGVFAHAQTSPTPSSDSLNDNSSTVDQLNQKINELQQKVSDLKSQ